MAKKKTHEPLEAIPLRLPGDMKSDLKFIALMNGMSKAGEPTSLNGLIIEAIKEYFQKEPIREILAQKPKNEN